MLLKSRKGQSMVEFALILPVFLLLLLGVVEGSRIVWAFITVQTAAREAARYAITGRPYVSVASATYDDGGQAKLYCETIEGQPDNSQPWICNPTDRLEAVKQVAIQRGRTLAVSQTCGQGKNADYLTYFDDENTDGECADQPGAFGVLVIGQKTNPDGPQPTPVQNYPGDQGLNVSVATYYNVQMLDPIYDALMGGSFVRVQGRVEMQNEGIDKSLGAVPPPPLPDVPIDGSGLPGQGTGPQILPAGSNEVEQNEVFGVQLLNHRNPPYDVWLAGPIGQVVTNTYKLCPPTDDGLTTLTTNANGNGVYDCRISTAVQPGQYRLYSTQEGVTTEVARYDFVTVNEGETPLIAISGGNTWAENTKIDISLLNHKVADQQFSLFFDDGGGPVQIGGPYDAEPAPLETWKIPSTASTTCSLSGLGCKIFSRSIGNPAASDPYAETDLFVIRPEIILSQGQVDYRPGETIRIALIGHTPNKQYEIQISSTPTGTVPSSYTAVRVTTDSAGQFSTQEVIIPEIGAGAWDNGDYTITTHQITGGVADLSNFIAEKDIRVDTPTGAYLTVDGGYTWPIDSFINIKVHQHTVEEHYLNFGNWRVINGGSDTFTPSANGTATLGYRIPITAVTGTAQDFLVRSFLNSTNAEVARETVRVLPKPVIQVLEGDKALPDAKITIRILNHSPLSSYKIYYGKEVGNAGSNGKDLGLTMITNSNGEATATYDLSKLPVSPPPNFADPVNCNCYGVPYEMYSESFFTDSSGKKERVAFTQLTIDSADLAITQIQVPSNPQINTTVPVTLTIQNLKPVTISRYFDIDVYQNPSPLIPSYKPGKFNFPGDEKLWHNYVAPNGQPGDTFTITSTLFLGQYGEQEVYGYADTSDFVFAENSETNNIGSNIFQVACVPTLITDNFNSSLSSAWQLKRYNTTYTQVTESQTSSGQLRFTSDGFSTYGTDDDASNRGHALLYRTTPVTTTNGLDVVVRLTQAPGTTGKAGIQLRDSIDEGRSRKVEFDIYQGSTVQVSYRDPLGADVTYWQGTATTSVPVWLRVQRLPSSNTFNFYYSTQTTQPTNWGTPYSSATIPMANKLYVGLFTASYSDNTYQQSRFDDFSYTDPASCPAAQGQLPVEPPPGLTLCTDLLVETGFETAPPQAWFWPAGQNVNLNPSSTEAHSGLFSLDASSFDSAYNSPAFYQRFTMPSWVISSTTTFNVNLYRNVKDDFGSSDPNDKFYAVVATTPAVASAVTTPTLVADGVKTTGWSFANQNLPVLAGTDLEPYAESDLYIYFYNTSNSSGCNPQQPATCHNSQFLFDDVQLTTCTTQPPPDVITTLLKGEVTLHRLGGSSQKVAGVKVWIYAENGDLFETFTDQNGNFSFYNLPATAAGVQYLIYSEHHVVDVFDATQIETLATDTSVILKSSNTQSKPLIVDLDLYTIVP